MLGATGMLGSAVLEKFQDSGFELIATCRNPQELSDKSKIKVKAFDAALTDFDTVPWLLEDGDYIVNCIGLIKSHIKAPSIIDSALAFRLNADLPSSIARYVSSTRIRVIQIATDCVFDGSLENYTEKSDHDAKDVYGVSKSLGEIDSPNFMNIRCSIVGPEKKTHSSIYDWFRLQPKNSQIIGYQNHIWNGVTSSVFARLCLGIVEQDHFRAGTFHFVPLDKITKYQLLELFQRKTGRTDIEIRPGNGPSAVNRSLATISPYKNVELWHCAGYETAPTISQLIEEM